ncbi:MAG: hypothetical protein HY905_08815 [Deltaproteobacteria bacterium]|nr:hypothetical protein [Deltaproteobacteria bacterium]
MLSSLGMGLTLEVREQDPDRVADAPCRDLPRVERRRWTGRNDDNVLAEGPAVHAHQAGELGEGESLPPAHVGVAQGERGD